MKKLKRPLSILLSVLMVVSMLVVAPVAASAAEERTFTETTTLNETKVGTEVWQINEDVTVTINGGLTITGELTVQGKGTLIVNGVNGYDGYSGDAGVFSETYGVPGTNGTDGGEGGDGTVAVTGNIKVDGATVIANGGDGGKGGNGGPGGWGADGGSDDRDHLDGSNGGDGGYGGNGGNGAYAFAGNVTILSGEVYGVGGSGGAGGDGGECGYGGMSGMYSDIEGDYFGNLGSDGNNGNPGAAGTASNAFASEPVVEVAHTIEGGSTQQNMVAVQDPTAYRYVKIVTTVAEPDYYVVGSFTDPVWTASDDYKMTLNTEAAGGVTEYMLTGVALTEGDKLKVKSENASVQGGDPHWYPDGTDNDYEVQVTGTYDIYCRPDYNGGDDWYSNCLFVQLQEEETTTEPTSEPAAEPITVVWNSYTGEFDQSIVKLTDATLFVDMAECAVGDVDSTGTFKTDAGVFTKIQISGGQGGFSGVGWSNGTWTGESSSVPFTGRLTNNEQEAEFTITFTIVPAPAEPSEPDPAADVTALIDALPAEITLDNAADVQAARQAYDALSDDDKQKIDAATLTKLTDAEAKIADLTAVKAVTDAINALPDTDSLTLDNSQAVADAVAAYSALTDAQRDMMDGNTEVKLYQAIAKLNNLAAAKAVENAIDALPSAADATLENKEAIEAARAAYNDLNDAQKALVPQASLTKLADNERKIENLEAAKAVTDAINALPATVTLDDVQTVSAARAAYNALSNDAKLLVPADTLAKLTDAEAAIANMQAADAVTNLINAIPATVTTQDEQQVATARAAYNALTEAQQALVDNDAVAKLEAAEKSINDQKAANAVIAQINALPTVIILEDKADVEAARAAYNDLTDDQKNLVTDETLNKLIAAETVIANREGAKAVEDMINALPDAKDITLADKAAVNAANEARLNLPPEQADYLTLAAIDKLFKAMDKIEDLEAAKAVTDQINALPADITLNDKAAVEAARQAYTDLTDDQKALVDDDTVAKLEGLEKSIADQEATNDVIAQIDALPAVSDITADDKDQIYAAKEAFDNLSDEAKALIPIREQTKLDAAVVTVDKAVKDAEDKAAAAEVTEMIQALPSATAITADAKDAVEQAAAAYDALTSDQKALVPLASRLKLTIVKGALDAALKQAEDEAAADAVTEMIAALPSSSNVTIDDKDNIEAAKAAYDALTSDQKKLVALTDRVKLAAVVGALAGIEDEIAADEVEALIEALPAADDVTIDDKADIEAARAAYDALTDAQKRLVVLADRTKLNRVEAALAQAEADIAAAQAVTEMIEALPAAEDVTLDDADMIAEVREAYDALTDAQKEFVTYETAAKLYDAEYALKQLTAVEDVKEMIDDLPDADDIAYGDKEAVEEARAAYDALNDDQKAEIDDETVAKLVAAEEAIRKIEDDMEAANDVSVLIKELPSALNVSIDNKEAIDKVAAAYDALTDAQKEYVPFVDKLKLTADRAVLAAIEKNIADQEAADEVAVLIEALPAAEDVTLENKDAIDQAKAAYNALTDDQKLLVPAEDKIKLVEDATAISKIENDIERADAVTNLIDSLPAAEELTYEDKADVVAAREAYDALYDDQKALVPGETVQKLEEAEAAMAVIAQVYDVEDAINALPAAEDITYADKADVVAARGAYDALTDDQKIQIPDETLQKLIDAEAAIEKIEEDIEAAAAVEDLIDALPLPTRVSYDDKDAIEEAQAAYDALTDEQKDRVAAIYKVKLAVDSAILEKIVEDVTAADAVSEMINAIPAVEDITYGDKDAIEAERAAYDELSLAQKLLVGAENYKKLTDAEDRLNSFVLLGDATGDGRITVMDITAIQRHIAEIHPLTGKRYNAADVNRDGVVNIEDATILQMYLAEEEVEYPIGEMA